MATIMETDILEWPNNIETILVQDRRGQAQSPFFMDSDDNLAIGVNDPRVINYTKSPADFWRLKCGSNFDAATLPPEFSSSVTGTGSIYPVAPGKIAIRTGSGAVGSGGKIWMNNVFSAIDYDTRLYFTLEVPNGLNIDLRFGALSINAGSGNYETSMFMRNEAGTVSNWEAFTQDAGGTPVGTVGSYGNDNQRRCGLIWMKGTSIEYYVGDSANNFQLIATHTTHLPAAGSSLVPFVSFYSAYTAGDKTMLLDTFWLSANA